MILPTSPSTEMGVISPTKLRMKLLGAHSCIKIGGSNSSQTSPSKIKDMENSKNRLLAGDFDEEVSCKDSKGAAELNGVADSEASGVVLSTKEVSSYKQRNQPYSCPKDLISKEKVDMGHIKIQTVSKNMSNQPHSNSNLSMIHPVRTLDVDADGYDSGHDNASTYSFEFHRVERTSQHLMIGPLNRHVPSKWNDAEKWIVSRQMMHPNVLKKTGGHNQGNCQMNSTLSRVAPESTIPDQKLQVADIRRIDPTNSTSQTLTEKFSFVPHYSNYNLVAVSGDSGQKEVSQKEQSVMERLVGESTVVPNVQSVLMRDVGTEMTPIPSQEPSRTASPLGSLSQTHSPIPSMPSTPRRGEQASTPAEATIGNDLDSKGKDGNKELSERELKLKTRREIAALGIQLGKMNIASWASKEEVEHASPALKALDVDHVKMDYEARAAAWEEAENTKHMARYRREEIKVQVWESHQKEKFEAKMKKIEAQAERMRARALKRMADKLDMTQKRVEEKRAMAEARMNQQAAKTAHKAKQICRTGQIPSNYLCCSGFF
ncbi:uncharacterized protein [Elaeis guineensis]|uniref:Uncharacterized protein LOC105035339 isoform X2 n=1 Tax=Elaeis guineensis var. tenera TaxID=51953 RepID=A0A8N4ERT1_ELAGV|nr:uncharacterized protein LOC105035339 isoform X2 [Elaeis guineensis]